MAMPETAQCALNVEKLECMTTLDTTTAVEAKDSTTVIGGLIHRYLTQNHSHPMPTAISLSCVKSRVPTLTKTLIWALSRCPSRPRAAKEGLKTSHPPNRMSPPAAHVAWERCSPRCCSKLCTKSRTLSRDGALGRSGKEMGLAAGRTGDAVDGPGDAPPCEWEGLAGGCGRGTGATVGASGAASSDDESSGRAAGGAAATGCGCVPRSGGETTDAPPVLVRSGAPGASS